MVVDEASQGVEVLTLVPLKLGCRCQAQGSKLMKPLSAGG